MFEKYNEKARRALFFSRYEASKLGHRVIESEHVLLGILREGEETIKALMAQFGVRPDQLRREIEGERVFVERVSSTTELPLSEETKRILAYAAHEAESMMNETVGSEHLLIGMLRVEGKAMQILNQAGLDLGKAREELAAMLPNRAATRRPVESEANASGGDFALIWDPEVVSPELYAELVVAIGNVARASGSKGIARIKSDYVDVKVSLGALV